MTFREIATNAEKCPSDANRCIRCEALKALCLRPGQITLKQRPAFHREPGHLTASLDQGIF